MIGYLFTMTHLLADLNTMEKWFSIDVFRLVSIINNDGFILTSLQSSLCCCSWNMLNECLWSSRFPSERCDVYTYTCQWKHIDQSKPMFLSNFHSLIWYMHHLHTQLPLYTMQCILFHHPNIQFPTSLLKSHPPSSICNQDSVRFSFCSCCEVLIVSCNVSILCCKDTTAFHLEMM